MRRRRGILLAVALAVLAAPPSTAGGDALDPCANSGIEIGFEERIYNVTAGETLRTNLSLDAGGVEFRSLSWEVSLARATVNDGVQTTELVRWSLPHAPESIPMNGSATAPVAVPVPANTSGDHVLDVVLEGESRRCGSDEWRPFRNYSVNWVGFVDVEGREGADDSEAGRAIPASSGLALLAIGVFAAWRRRSS